MESKQSIVARATSSINLLLLIVGLHQQRTLISYRACATELDIAHRNLSINRECSNRIICRYLRGQVSCG